ncbi:hypothetical protein H0H87_010240 [Tephrocybe sp. NHM501043]|nr:hypothetical protein H0H87_010240 [Tephrocybe sp. NHM501043]
MHLLRPVILYSLISACFAFLVNITVDDTLGNPNTGAHITYFPADRWNNGATCTQCNSASHLDRNQVHNGMSREYADMIFLIDWQPAGNYYRVLTGDGAFEYNTLVFGNQTLPQGNHTLTIQNGHVGGTRSRVLLDYITYTYDNGLSAPLSSSSLSQHSPISTASASAAATVSSGTKNVTHVNSSGKIVGGVLGSIGIILLALLAFLWYRQQHTKKGSLDLSNSPTPPKSLPANPVARVRGWWHDTSSAARSRFSFNPNLLVEPMMRNRNSPGSLHLRRPPPVTIVQPVQPLPPRPDSTRPLQPNREATPTPSLDARNEQSQPLSIVEWQRRTHREADDVPPRFDVSDVEMSSYYDFSSDNPDPSPLPQPRPRSTPRRFTVVNV